MKTEPNQTSVSVIVSDNFHTELMYLYFAALKLKLNADFHENNILGYEYNLIKASAIDSILHKNNVTSKTARLHSS